MIGVITKIQEKENQVTYEVKGQEKVLVKISSHPNYSLGDKVRVKGTFQIPEKNHTELLFDYQTYLKRKRIFYIVEADSITRIQKNHNILYQIRNILQKRLHENPYLNTFILGDKSYLSKEAMRSFQENGISHLFAISGMHITLFASILQKIGKRFLKEEKRYQMISLILLFYLLLVGFSPSILRGVLFYILFQGNQVYYFYIQKEHLFLLSLSISLLIDPFSIWDTGFQYSYLISYSLLKMSNQLSSPSKFLSLGKVSLCSFITSIPITLYNYNQMNIMSIFYNCIFVPYVSIILFPSSFVVAIFPFLEPIYFELTTILEKTSIFLSHITWGKIIMKQIPTPFYFLYLGILLLYLNHPKKIIIYCFFFLLMMHWMIPLIDSTNYVEAIDVGQGDSILIHTNHKNVLMDTGGSYQKDDSLFYNTISPLLKKEGVGRIDALIITHGDFDHMGEAINLVNNFKVEKVIFNCGSYNDLENDLIKVLDKKKIPYYSCIKELNIDNKKLYFLQTKEYDNENDNSSVIYLNLNNYKFLFMGDASITTENEILKKYNLSNIDVLKVGHHGSRTSSGKEFINKIKPKYSIISVGANNKFKHPNKEALDNLSDSKIYRTDLNGSIMIKIKNNRLKIETCSP